MNSDLDSLETVCDRGTTGVFKPFREAKVVDNRLDNSCAYEAARKRMVREQLSDLPPGVRAAMGRVPRHEFVPAGEQSLAYADRPLPLGCAQTISQPWIVGLMTAQLDPQPSDRVLEIGTGSGYQAAVLAELAAEVFTIEIVASLAQRAEGTLRRLGYDHVYLRVGDGFGGWPEAAPFDAVLVTCAPEQVPTPLVQQLREGGRLSIPIGPPGDQELYAFDKRGQQLIERARLPVRFVPMTGLVQHGRPSVL